MLEREGVVIIAQETRFQLVDDGGVAHHFVLAHGANVEPSALAELQSSRSRIRVRYKDAADLLASAAHHLALCTASNR